MLSNQAFAASLKDKLGKDLGALLSRAADKDLSIAVLDLQTGESLFEYNGELLLKPASVLKLLTSAAALQTLGTEYRFATKLLASKKIQHGRIEKLYVKGGGDPSLTVESAWNMARELKLMGVEAIDALVFDDSEFMADKARQGQRAYQTGASALSFNFNSITFQVCPGTSGSAALVRVDPIEVKLDFVGMIKTTKGSSANLGIDELPANGARLRYQVSGSIGAESQCIKVYRSVAEPVRYFAETFRQLLKDVGIKVGNQQSFLPTPSDAVLLHQNLSKPLSEIVKDLNHFSNNFIAEQLVYQLSLNASGKADRNSGLSVMQEYLTQLGFKAGSFALFDASGLSHENRLSARMIVQILLSAHRNQGWGTEFESSLSIASRSGTLKKREFDLNGATLRGKTGSLDGVSSLAGFIFAPHGNGVAFAILINGAASKDRALNLEAQLVEAMARAIN